MVPAWTVVVLGTRETVTLSDSVLIAPEAEAPVVVVVVMGLVAALV